MARGGYIVGFGDKGFERAINRFEKRIIREVKRIVAETAEMAAASMKVLAPTGEIDGGSLKKSIEVIYSQGGLTAILKVGVDYAWYVEYGTGIYSTKGDGRKTPWVYYSTKLKRWVFTHGMEAQPFWFPSLDKAFKHFVKEMNKLG
jgi:Bacteriophage HK97-gp10, putative tail-component